MANSTHSEAENLRVLADQKEKEWRQLQELRANSMEVALQENQKELAEQRAKFQKLKEDFKYNLRLMAERDSELAQYDASTTALKSHLVVKDTEISELKIKIDELKSAIEREEQGRLEMQSLYQQRIREKQDTLEKYRLSKESEVGKIRDEYGKCKRALEIKVTELEEEIDVQRNELSSGFDDEMRKREQDYRREIEEMSCSVLANELKMKLLQKELDQIKSIHQETMSNTEETEKSHRQMMTDLKHKDWEIQDLKAMHKARLNESETKLKNSDQKLKQLQEEASLKHETYEKKLKDRDVLIGNLRHAAKESDDGMNEKLMAVQSQLEEKEIEVRNLRWQKEDREAELEALVLSLKNELEDVKGRMEKELSDRSSGQLAKDHELIVLRETESKLKNELILRKRDIERYKRELQTAIERESNIERSKSQLGLDWQRRFDDVERQQYQKSEDFVRTLSTARDEAIAEASQKQREIEHQSDLIQMLHKERDQAFATLKKHGLIIDRDIKINVLENQSTSAADQVKELQEQNDNLRQVIRQMREEIERIEDGSGVKRSSVAEDYIRNVEDELQSMKSKYRQLKDDYDSEIAKKGEAATSNINSEVVKEAMGTNTAIKSHIEQLNQQMGKLRQEKVTLTSVLRKQQTRIEFFEKQLNETAKLPREKSVEIEQLKYELGAQNRQHQVEVASLKQRAAEAELQAAESRKEAEEYHRACVQSTAEVTALQTQLSQMKIDLSDVRPTVNFGAQELFIQQLQDEIQTLRSHIQGSETVLSEDPHHDTGSNQGQIIAQLHQKLKAAARHIKQLSKEKETLIEVGNRLRATLNNNGIRPPSPTQPHAKMKTEIKNPKAATTTNQLKMLENLQYELTKQELALQQQKEAQQRAALSSRGGEAEFQPQSILKNGKNSTNDGDPMHSAHRQQGRSSSPLRKSAEGMPSVGISLSSVGGESLQEIWKMLDDEGNQPLTLAENSGPFTGIQFPGDETKSQEMVLEGRRSRMEAKNKPTSSKLSPRTAGRVIRSHLKKKQAIRNYNDRDDN